MGVSVRPFDPDIWCAAVTSFPDSSLALLHTVEEPGNEAVLLSEQCILE